MVHSFEQMAGLSTGALGAWGPFVLALVILAAAFIIILKGFALWYSARASQKWWFIALLVLNTLGILEAVYLLFFRKKEGEDEEEVNEDEERNVE